MSQRTTPKAVDPRPRTSGEPRRSLGRDACVSLLLALLALLLLWPLAPSALGSREGSGAPRPERAADSVNYSVVSAKVNTLRPKEGSRADTNVSSANLMGKVVY